MAKQSLRRRFLTIGVPGLAIVLAATTVGFLAGTGSVTITPTGSGTGSSDYLFVVKSSTSTLPMTGALEAGSAGTASSKKFATIVSGTISDATTPGTVTKAGDLALVDTQSSAVTVSIYLTNLATLRADYLALILPIEVYKATCSPGATVGGVCSAVTAWTLTRAATPTPTTGTPITTTTGQVSFSLPAGHYYDVVLKAGGFLAKSGAGYAGPQFYFTAHPY